MKYIVITAILFLSSALIGCDKERIEGEAPFFEKDPEAEISLDIDDSTPGIAFPGAFGYGSKATGGRGGKVVAVTNLLDSGPGSLRQAFMEYPDEPITIVFKVGGLIELSSDIKVSRSDITLAGQTAPGDGICISGGSLIFNGARVQSQGGNHGNIIVRYIRSRPGTEDPKGSYGFNLENYHTVIIDHCSFGWANEECVATYDTRDVTIQWCIVSEGLYDAGHQKGVRGYGGIWGGTTSSFHHNLIAHNVSRTLGFNGSRAHDTIARVDYRNNVIYNWGGNLGCYGGLVELPGGSSQINMVNNYYKPGPATPDRGIHFMRTSYNADLATGVGQVYLTGNMMDGRTEMTADNWLGLNRDEFPEALKSEVRMDAAFTVESFAELPEKSAAQAYLDVLAGAGATLPRRDAVDMRVVQETRNGNASGTGNHGGLGMIDSPDAVGGYPVYESGKAFVDNDGDGMPDYWERKLGLDPADPSDGNAFAFSDHYTNLEVYLNSLIKR